MELLIGIKLFLFTSQEASKESKFTAQTGNINALCVCEHTREYKSFLLHAGSCDNCQESSANAKTNDSWGWSWYKLNDWYLQRSQSVNGSFDFSLVSLYGQVSEGHFCEGGTALGVELAEWGPTLHVSPLPWNLRHNLPLGIKLLASTTDTWHNRKIFLECTWSHLPSDLKYSFSSFWIS